MVLSLLAVLCSVGILAGVLVSRFRPNPRSLYELHVRIGIGLIWLGVLFDLIRCLLLRLLGRPADFLVMLWVGLVVGLGFTGVNCWRVWRMKVRSGRGHDIGR